MSESRTVLFVDDEDGILLAYLRCLSASAPTGPSGELAVTGPLSGGEEFGSYRLLVARSGQEAVDLVRSEMDLGRRVACGFFDMKMPGGLDGLETIKRVRELDPDLLCTVVTAHVGASVREIQGLFEPDHVDEWDYLAKPFSRWEIVQKCRQMVGSWNRRRREEAQVAEIKRLNRELELWSASLEKRIEERTAALATAATELRRKNHELEVVLEALSRTQAQLVQQEKMASIGQLAAGVAHEVSGPLDLVRRNLATLAAHGKRLATFVARLDALVQEPGNVADSLGRTRLELRVDAVLDAVPDLVEETLSATRRMTRILESLRAFSLPIADDAAPRDVNATVRDALALVTASLGDAASLKVSLADAPPVRCHAASLQQVWLALLSNALHAVEGLERRVEIRVTSRQVDGDVVVEVSDNGRGMSPEVAARVFEPFFTTRAAGDATGLGLSVAYGIVRQHGGSIEVESARDGGSTFTVRLPTAAECQDEAPSCPTPAASKRARAQVH